MKLVQLVLLCSCLMAGGVRADIIPVGSKSENLSSTSIMLDKEWLDKAAQSSGSAQVHEWNISGENQYGGCGFLCLEMTANSQKVSHMSGLVKINSNGEQTVYATGYKNLPVKINATLSNVTAHGVLYAKDKKVKDEYYTDVIGSGKVIDTGPFWDCLLIGCDFRFKAGISGGSVALSMSVPDSLLQGNSFTIPETTIATLIADFYSDDALQGIVNERVFRYTAYIKIPSLTITFPERCYTHLSGSTITFKSDIDASTVTTTGSPAIDTKSITLSAGCNAILLSKSVHASVKLVQMNGVEDNYKFKLTPKKNDYGLNRSLSVVARNIASGSAGAKTCGKDTNTMENNKLYYVGRVAFPGSNGALNDPYNITFNLCAFRPEGSSELLPPGEYTGAVRVVTRFYTADQ